MNRPPAPSHPVALPNRAASSVERDQQELPMGSDLIRRIGQTPLLRLSRVAAHLPGRVALYGKAEHMNPGGSVKDRPARRMIQEGRRRGSFRPGQTLIDATSGNTGIAYAMIGAAEGFPVRLLLPRNATAERRKILRAHGALLTLTDPMEGTDGARRQARTLAEKHPDRFFYPDQYSNPANWKAHHETTASELLAQAEGPITDFVAGLGTTGTFVGVARRLKEEAGGEDTTDTRCHALQPDGPLHGLEGLKHMDTATVPAIYDAALADRHWRCSTEEAQAMTRRLAREEGLLVGTSTGANVATALKVAEEHAEEGRPARVVTILCDTGTRYLGEDFWT